MCVNLAYHIVIKQVITMQFEDKLYWSTKIEDRFYFRASEKPKHYTHNLKPTLNDLTIRDKIRGTEFYLQFYALCDTYLMKYVYIFVKYAHTQNTYQNTCIYFKMHVVHKFSIDFCFESRRRS